MSNLKIGSFVQINCHEGFGGRGFVVGHKPELAACWTVQIHDPRVSTQQFYPSELALSEMSRDDVMRATLVHVRRVGELLAQMTANLTLRAVNHDASKFTSWEFDAFAEATPKLAVISYGSDEYKQSLAAIRPAVEQHYKSNSHHPEHFETGTSIGGVAQPSGIDGMDLLDLIEMLCDWKAAGERHADGSIVRSIEVNTERFKLCPQLVSILTNTVKRAGWAAAGGVA